MSRGAWVRRKSAELRARSTAAAEIATVATNEPDDAVAEALMRLSARILVTTSADWNPRATAIEVDSWDLPTDWEMAG